MPTFHKFPYLRLQLPSVFFFLPERQRKTGNEALIANHNTNAQATCGETNMKSQFFNCKKISTLFQFFWSILVACEITSGSAEFVVITSEVSTKLRKFASVYLKKSQILLKRLRKLYV